MSLVKDLRHCMRLVKQCGFTKMIHNGQVGAMSMEQRRHFRYDDRFNWPSGNPGDSKIFTEEGFDPRYDERHYKSYQRNAGFDQGSGWKSSDKDPESRRRVQQNMMEHKRRQDRIIQENKYRWQHRSESRTGIKLNFAQPVYGAGPGNRGNPAEKHSRGRTGRVQRQKEVKRQARELRESRKNYNLPGYNRPSKSEAMDDAPVASKAWLQKKAREEEQKYWHTWSTCPEDLETAEDASEEIMTGYEGPRGSKRGLTKPPQPYDGGVRRFQTHSAQLADRKVPVLAPPHQREGNRFLTRRKPNGMEKQYRLARDFTRVNRITNESDVTLEEFSKCFRRPSSLLQSHVFRSSPMELAATQPQDRLQDIEQLKQPPRIKLAWQGLPRPVYRRFDSIKQAVGHSKRPLQPPRFKMTVKSKALKRLRTPIGCFSDKLAINTRFTPQSEYLGFGRQTVCDVWQNFTKRP